MKLVARRRTRGGLVQEHQVELDVVQLVAAGIQIGRTPLDGLVRHRLLAGRGHDRIDRALDEVLIDAAAFVEEAKSGFDPMHQGLPLLVGEAFVVDALHPVHQTDVAGLGQKRTVIDEAPQREQFVQAAGICVVAQDAGEAHHDDTSMSIDQCFPGSYRRRALEEARRIRRSSGSRCVAHRAPPYRPPNINRPARNE